QAIDHPRDRSELAAWIDADLDTTAGGFFHRLLVEFDVLMLALVEGGGAELHDEICGHGRISQRASEEGNGEASHRAASHRNGRRHDAPSAPIFLQSLT